MKLSRLIAIYAHHQTFLLYNNHAHFPFNNHIKELTVANSSTEYVHVVNNNAVHALNNNSGRTLTTTRNIRTAVGLEQQRVTFGQR